MKKILGAILVAGTAVLGGVPAAQAGGATDAALGLGAFAVFNQLVRGETVFNLFHPAAPVVVSQPVVVAPPPVVVVPPPRVVYAPPPGAAFYGPPPVVYAPPPASVYYARVPPGHYKQVHPSPGHYKHYKQAHSKKAYQGWNRPYRPY